MNFLPKILNSVFMKPEAIASNILKDLVIDLDVLFQLVDAVALDLLTKR